jgi:hypothetical protein
MAQQTATKWSYLIVGINNGKIDSLNNAPASKGPYKQIQSEEAYLQELGADGWELVAALKTPTSGLDKLYFKRPPELR